VVVEPQELKERLDQVEVVVLKELKERLDLLDL
jgi:hypothetical protein